jgi:phosphatidylinositol alpha-mannosyltransferase
VVASDLPAFFRLLRGGDAGETGATWTPIDLARARALLRNPARREQLVAAGSERANAFDWSVFAQHVLA